MENMLKTLIIITLIFYLLKGLIYLILWQTTYRVQQKALEAKAKRLEKKKIQEEIWHEEE